jgi:hypothetical protein
MQIGTKIFEKKVTFETTHIWKNIFSSFFTWGPAKQIRVTKDNLWNLKLS